MADVTRGSLVIADIGGYTKYLTGVELEHSHDILADLMNVVVDNLGAALELAKLEGDAAFCFDRNAHPDGQALVAAIDATYFGFKKRVRDIVNLTTCTCNACVAIPSLDLKFVAHHGSFIEHVVARRPELVGPDVIRVHRLLKNTITEEAGLHAYAFLTEECIDRCQLDPGMLGLKEHTEIYEDVGEVRGLLLDLQQRWREHEERTSVYVRADEASIRLQCELPLTQAKSWELMTTPGKQTRWIAGIESMEERHENGLRGVGTQVHCVHGGMAIDQEIVDWKPFRYASIKSQAPFGSMIITFELSGLAPEKTHLDYRVKFIVETDEDMAEMMRPMLEQQMGASMENLIAVAAASGPEARAD